MYSWQKKIRFENNNYRKEVWEYENLITKDKKFFYPEVFYNKFIDITSLKLFEVENFNKEISKIKKSRKLLYGGNNLVKVNYCPICKSTTPKDFKIIFEVYRAKYVQCKKCLHCYIVKTLKKDILENFYSQNNDYQKTYTDKRTLNIRVNQVATPKANWTLQLFKNIYKKNPKSILDIGAGSGHFVHACRKLGLKADGIEISKSGREFCKNNFNINLIDKDFLETGSDYYNKYDIVSFWGIIEHVNNPMDYINKASKIIEKNNGLVIASVPRWDSFSTAIQEVFPDSIVRHLDPLGHINCFTDSSIATAFVLNKLNIIAAWYFGMDIYELIMQLSNLSNNNKIIHQSKFIIPNLQKSLSQNMLSDEIVLVGNNEK